MYFWQAKPRDLVHEDLGPDEGVKDCVHADLALQRLEVWVLDLRALNAFLEMRREL